MTDSPKKSLEALAPGRWDVSSQPDAGITDTLTMAGGGWQGIAYTTSGARAVRRHDANGWRLISTERDERGEETEVPLGTVFELRLWSPRGKDADTTTEVLAEEVRWLNGSGAAVVRVSRTGTPVSSGGQECWYRVNDYLQHGADGRTDDEYRMTSVEVFMNDPAYGNTVFVDELMTGKWA